MANSKKASGVLAEFAPYELAFLERKLEEMQAYIDKNPLDKIEDRYDKEGERVVAKIEEQVKSMVDTSKRYAEITEIVARMRKEEDRKMQSEVRGAGKLSPLDKGLLDDD